MKAAAFILSAALAATAPFAALADNGKDKGKGHGKVKHTAQSSAAQHCPPGLAKKNPPCIPPGQAKKHPDYADAPYVEGDLIVVENYARLENPERYGLEADETYYRVGDYLYRVDEESAEVLDLVGAIAAVLN
ncbi:hypothetical protein N6L24_04315 [Cognatishimia sp. SS12]|uniref:hypothetical protein n=1 Tax=Cognatishimia sp. SS12 TaxID=2979465 RepID=UPI00232BF050|nr:hypothetical protein [Cognatishimia sp. SS12]MDC0737489.1 hypothetical protein [Cognatishimia sp. SS12]